MSTISSVSTGVVPPPSVEGPRRSPQDIATHHTSGQRPLAAASKTVTSKKLPASPSQETQAVIVELSRRDAEVRRHEAAHAATGGQFAGAPSFQFEKGPDGRNYAVSGEVPIDLSPVPNNPEATIQKMRQVKRAALAPANPSAADRGVAASADRQALAAQLELNQQRAEKTQEELQEAQGTAIDTRQRTQADHFNEASSQTTPELISIIA